MLPEDPVVSTHQPPTHPSLCKKRSPLSCVDQAGAGELGVAGGVKHRPEASICLDDLRRPTSLEHVASGCPHMSACVSVYASACA